MTAILPPTPQPNKQMIEIENWNSDAFHFGIEAEYLLVDRESFTPLWYRDLSFARLNTALEAIDIADLPSMAGTEIELPHTKAMPYVVEGYHQTDAQGRMVDILPKGLEIRTPIYESLTDCLAGLKTLHTRMQIAIAELGYAGVSLSYHPIETEFYAERGERRHDFWQWAMQAMLTYGPDINLSLPAELNTRLDLADLELKINYYAPAMAAFSLASPFYAGDIWKVRGRLCKSFRTHRRSTYAPAVELHPNEQLRLEFKPFEMSWRLQDFENYFLLFLTLVLDDGLTGRASNQMRIYDLGAVARWGFYAEEIAVRAEELLARAPKVLADWGFDPKPLSSFEKRAYFRKTPADELIDRYAEANRDLTTVLRSLTELT